MPLIFALIANFFVIRPCFALSAATEEVLQQDLNDILVAGGFTADSWKSHFETSTNGNDVSFRCGIAGQPSFISVRAKENEQISTFYYGLHKMGFLFPHPKMQISPNSESIKKVCNKKFLWQPTTERRGFHFHTQHPNEWVSGFFENEKGIAVDSIKWLARNFQNTLQLEMLKGSLPSLAPKIAPLIRSAHDYGLQFGLSISFSMIQQKSFHLLPLWSALTNYHADERITSASLDLVEKIPVDFLTVEMGSTEFSSLNYDHAIHWLNTLANALHQKNIYLLAKIHASTNQQDEEHGNFNFLPRLAQNNVGVLPHTVFFYGLEDPNTPMYGRKNFSDIDAFMKVENLIRRTWYFPETSYFIGMDIDVPLFLTDYLRARARDLRKIYTDGIRGHLTFTTGQELGYWLFDWNIALQTTPEYLGDEMAGLRLLGEDLTLWKSHLDFQTKFFKDEQLIQTITAENLMDELPFFKPIHDRILIRDLFQRATYLNSQITKLDEALKALPSTAGIKNLELRQMLQVTLLRLQHAYYLRQAIADRRDKIKMNGWLSQAAGIRESAGAVMRSVEHDFSRYPKSIVFQRGDNSTSYSYGYGWAARTLFFWSREEHIVADRIRNPFFENLYDPFKILF